MKKKRVFIIALMMLVCVNMLYSQTYTYPLKGTSGFSVSNQTRDGLRVNYNIGQFSLNTISYRSESMSEISIPAIVLPNEAGCPNLPVESRFVAIPQGAEARLEVIACDTAIIRNVNIAPALRIQPGDEEPDMNYVKDQKVYSKNAFYPTNPFAIDKVNLRGVDAVAVSISPFQYNPVTKELMVFNHIELSLRYEGGNGHFGDDQLRSLYWDPILEQNLANYDQLPVIDYEARMQEWIKSGSTGWEYLIIIPTNENFRAPANQLRDYRIAQGIKTKVVTLAEIGCALVPHSNQLKTYIHNAYNNWDIKPVAVLLMGDHHLFPTQGIMGEVVPHPADEIDNCITDNGYADVNGDNLPDIVFSRLVAANATEAQMMVNKQIEYEYTNVNTDAYTYGRPITATGWQTERWFQICNEAVGGWWRNQGKNPVRINEVYSESSAPGNIWSTKSNTNAVVSYFGPDGRGYIPASPATLGGWTGGTATQVVQAVNNGAFILQHSDHANPTRWGEPYFTVSNVSSLTNENMMTFLVGNDCSSGQFNYQSDCLAEAFMRRTYNNHSAGAVGCIAPTAISYSYVTDVFLWGMYDLFDGSFLPDFGPYDPAGSYTGNWMPAFGNVAGKYFLAQNTWANSHTSVKPITYQIYTAHCDAFLRLYTQVPSTFTLSVPSQITPSTTSITMTAPQGSVIALTNNNSIIALAVGTGSSQTIQFAKQPGNSTVKVVVTKQNYIRSVAEIQVVGVPEINWCVYSDVTQNAATLLASVNPKGAATSYYFVWGTTESYGNQTEVRYITSDLLNSQAASYRLTGLQSDRTYHFRLYVQNSYGVTFTEDIPFHTLGTSNNPPTIPSNPSPSNGATEVFDCVSFSWTSTDPEGGNVNYNLYLGTTPSNMSLIATGPGTILSSYNLSFETTYYWKVVSFDDQNNHSDASPVWHFRTANGDYPVIVSSGYSNPTSSSVTLKGCINPRNLDTYYYFEYGTTVAYGEVTDVYSLEHSLNSSNVAINVNGLTSGTEYHFRLVAFNEKGEQYGADRHFSTSAGTSYQISASASPSAGGSVTGGGSYYQNQTCQLRATPNSGYDFVKWTKNGTQVSTNPLYSFQVTQSATYVAHFSSNTATYVIYASANPSEGGSVSGGGSFEEGETCVLTATPNSDYSFVNWTDGGTQVSTNASYSFTVSGNRNLVANFTENEDTGTGVLDGVFSVSSSTNVHFSKGNLQYRGSTKTWRFALNQYDYIGADNANASQSYNGWVDAFGWGTSGNNHGAVSFLPYSTSTLNSDYYAYGSSSSNLFDQSGIADWGCNRITNGGNTLDMWRTLTRDEWSYLINTRNTSSGIRYAKARVNGVNGLVLLPDDWSSSYYSLNSTNNGSASFSANVISLSSWTNNLEAHGAVFLPAAGMRHGTQTSSVGSCGLYWSSSYYDSNNASYLELCSDGVEMDAVGRCDGLSVRLVVSLENTAYSISVTPNPTSGGTVSGGGVYDNEESCTIRAYPATGYNFSNWTKNGEVVSTNATYTFTVTENATYVANFGMKSYTVSAAANPEEGGMVSGAGSYHFGSACTLEATSNAGYTFENWTENGTVVSTSASYSFTVYGSKSLVANFTLNPVSYSVIVTSNPSYGGVVSGGGAYQQGQICTLTAAANSGHVFENWTENGSVVSSGVTYSFIVSGNRSLVANFEPTSTNITTHAQTLTAGWNWWSTFIEPEGDDGLTQLENSLGWNGQMIKSRSDGYVASYQYNGETEWFGSLTSICNEQMYKIMMNDNGNATLTGVVANPSSHPITINYGWNWLGFPSSQSVGVTEALGGFNPAENDVLKGRGAFTTYYSYNGTSEWFGTLNTLVPGNGYMYHSQSSGAKTLVFQSGRPEENGTNITPDNNVFQPVNQQYADNMAVIAMVEVEDEVLRSDQYELAAFVDGECRGSVRLLYVEPMDRYLAFLTVFGEPDEEVEFRLTDGTKTLVATEELAFASDAVVGTISSPKVLCFGTTRVEETPAMVRIYPNPVHTGGELHLVLPMPSGQLKIEIYNVLGMRVYRRDGIAFSSSTAGLVMPDVVVTGAYVLKATTQDGIVYYGKLIVN
jgi:hypothetical protein